MGTFAEKRLDPPEGKPEQGVLRTVGGRAPKLLEPVICMSQSALKRTPSPDSIAGKCAQDGEDAAVPGGSPLQPVPVVSA